MSNKKITFLGVLAIVSVVTAIFVSQISHRMKPAPAGQGNLIQGLDPAAIWEIVTGKGSETVNLKRRGKGFVVANKSFYPASNKAINDLLAACLDIRIVEVYTEEKANYKDLGVSEEDAKDIVKFLDSNGKIITGVIIGNPRQERDMAYGRLVNDNKVYVIYNPPWVKQSPLEYIEQELISADKANIDSVTVTSPNETYTLTGEANGTEAILKELPAGKQQKKNECEAVLDVLTSLRIDDVNAAGENPDLKFERKFQCLLKDSTLYTIEIAQSSSAKASADKKDSKTFAKCSVEFTDKTAVKKEQGVESQEELKKKEAKLLAREKSMKFQETCEGWIYEIPDYKAKNMTRPMAELVEDVNSELNGEGKLTTN
ncbi:MAG: DUF4340 domain-containing protein [Phycisphaerae bacterium]|nr:DUF4340 domain-containing protein [Phycisphaerae bacterium]